MGRISFKKWHVPRANDVEVSTVNKISDHDAAGGIDEKANSLMDSPGILFIRFRVTTMQN